ncbi:MAG: hypothetical protein ABMA01_17105 [Chthoniobacteraceae bacterium]
MKKPLLFSLCMCLSGHGKELRILRGEQANGELVWASPMWITYQGAK